MGGNAIANTRRIDKREFLTIQSKIVDKLSDYFDIYTVPYYRNKESFGDVDLLVNGDKPDNLLEILQKELSIKDWYFNDSVISFGYNNVQIDLIFTNHLETHLNYLSWNDINNLVGVVARTLGLKHSHKGLYKKIVYKSKVNEVFITDDLETIYSLLGYDYETYKLGFDSLNDIFKFVISGKYFNADSFNFENLNHQNKTRNKKRKVYTDFLNFLNYNKTHSFYLGDFDIRKEIKMNIGVDLEKIENQFIAKVDNELEFNSKINGDIIMSLIHDLKGKELGIFIKFVNTNKELINFSEIDNSLLYLYNLYLKSRIS